jgi:hypothetical protein
MGDFRRGNGLVVLQRPMMIPRQGGRWGDVPVAIAVARRIMEEEERERATKDLGTWLPLQQHRAVCSMWQRRAVVWGMRLAVCGGMQQRAAACSGVQRCVMACNGNMRWHVACGNMWGHAAACGMRFATGGRMQVADGGCNDRDGNAQAA